MQENVVVVKDSSSYKQYNTAEWKPCYLMILIGAKQYLVMLTDHYCTITVYGPCTPANLHPQMSGRWLYSSALRHGHGFFNAGSMSQMSLTCWSQIWSLASLLHTTLQSSSCYNPNNTDMSQVTTEVRNSSKTKQQQQWKQLDLLAELIMLTV